MNLSYTLKISWRITKYKHKGRAQKLLNACVKFPPLWIKWIGMSAHRLLGVLRHCICEHRQVCASASTLALHIAIPTKATGAENSTLRSESLLEGVTWSILIGSPFQSSKNTQKESLC